MSPVVREAPELTTARLRLTPHRPDDFDASLGMWSSPEVTRFIGGRPSTREEVWSRLLRYGGLWPMLGFGYWAIRTRDDESFLGEVGFADFGRQTEPVMPPCPEMGWALRPEVWGRGYAQEAIVAVLAWADISLDAQSTCCMITPENLRSIALAERSGFRFAGELVYRSASLRLYQRAAACPSA